MMTCDGAPPVTAHKWEAVDLCFTGMTQQPNPFVNRIIGHFTGPLGERLSIPGFYDGDSRWIVRFAPTSVGEWQYCITADISEIDGTTGAVTVLENTDINRRGALRVDECASNHFVYEDGTHPFIIGFECDWLFALDLATTSDLALVPGLDMSEVMTEMGSDSRLPKTGAVIKMMKENGFNQVVMNVYAHDVKWGGDGQGSSLDYGPPAAFVFGGSNDFPDHSTLNTAFFRHLDRVIRLLEAEGIIAHLMLYVWNKCVSWPSMGSREDDIYLDYVVARYQAMSNIVWDVSKEALLYGKCEPGYITGRIKRIRERDAYKRLITVHDDRYCRECPHEVDFYSIQFWGTKLYDKMRTIRQQYPDMPVYNIEHGGYERGPYRTFIGDYQDPVTCLARNYECIFAGTYSTYYWQDASWDIVVTDIDSIYEAQRPRLRYFLYMQDYFGKIGYHRLSPIDTPASSGLCLADPDRLYVIYKRDGESLHVSFGENSGRYSAEWFNPLTGEVVHAGIHDSFSWREFESPWGTSMTILKLERIEGIIK